jgi:hypothetical protein
MNRRSRRDFRFWQALLRRSSSFNKHCETLQRSAKQTPDRHLLYVCSFQAVQSVSLHCVGKTWVSTGAATAGPAGSHRRAGPTTISSLCILPTRTPAGPSGTTGRSWRRATAGLPAAVEEQTDDNLFGVHFANAHTGWAAGERPAFPMLSQF